MTQLTDAEAAQLRALHRNAVKEDDDIQFYSGVAKRGATEKFYHAAIVAIPDLLNEREELIKERDQLKADAIVAEEQYLQGRQEEITYATNMRDERDAAIARAEKAEVQSNAWSDACIDRDAAIECAVTAKADLFSALALEKVLREALMKISELDYLNASINCAAYNAVKIALAALNASKKETGG